MVRSTDIPAVTAFTDEFSRVLRTIVDDSGVSRQMIADEAGRSRAFVSDQLLGKRPVDTDILSAAATSMGWPVRYLVRQILDQLPPDMMGIPGIRPTDDLAARRALNPPAQEVKRAARKSTKPKKS